METETRQQRYMTERWQSQRDYYSRKAARSKKWHQSLQVFVALSAVAIPVLLVIPEMPKIIPAIMSGLVAAATALENVYHFGDDWRNFRQTLESLKRERALYDAAAGPYGSPKTAFRRFVERSENIIAEETGRYFPPEADAQPEIESEN
jgi:hypothetical protein